MLRRGVEPLPIAWKAIILPLDHRSVPLVDGGKVRIIDYVSGCLVREDVKTGKWLMDSPTTVHARLARKPSTVSDPHGINDFLSLLVFLILNGYIHCF